MVYIVKDIYEGNITIEEANDYETNLFAAIMNFRKNAKPKSQEKKTRKRNCSRKLV